MKIFLAILVTFLLAGIISASSSAVSSESLTLDQSSPVTWGQPFTLTAIFTSAHKKSWPPRIYNPTVAVECASYRGAAFWAGGKHYDNLGGGFWTSNYPFIAQGSGSANCTAWLEFTDSVGNTTILASTQFAIN